VQPSPWRSRTERGFGGNKGGPERSDTRAPLKPRAVREVWRSQTCNRGRLSLLTFFASRERSKESKWPRGQKAQSKTITKMYKKHGFLKNCLTLNLPMDCRIKFGNDGFTFQATFINK
jgi:hypothetical protein